MLGKYIYVLTLTSFSLARPSCGQKGPLPEEIHRYRCGGAVDKALGRASPFVPGYSEDERTGVHPSPLAATDPERATSTDVASLFPRAPPSAPGTHRPSTVYPRCRRTDHGRRHAPDNAERVQRPNGQTGSTHLGRSRTPPHSGPRLDVIERVNALAGDSPARGCGRGARGEGAERETTLSQGTQGRNAADRSKAYAVFAASSRAPSAAIEPSQASMNASWSSSLSSCASSISRV